MIFNISVFVHAIKKSFNRHIDNDNDNDNESDFIAMNYINHIIRDIQARLIDGK